MTAPIGEPVPLAVDLAQHGDRVAIVSPHETLTYGELATRVAAAAHALGTRRRLVMLAGSNDVDTLVAYLGTLAAGHVAALVPGDDVAKLAALVECYDPDVTVGVGGSRGRITVRRDGSAHRLHAELALLLTTSGSTGSPKLVRLSQDNLMANARSIVDYLGITPDDVAVTTLPLHYSYGLSVVHSHLVAGATLCLTNGSVLDDPLWDLARSAGATSFAGVPYTFDLLDRRGFTGRELPRLRYVTQAGGRMAPDAVRRYAALGARCGWDFVVMYGQTEATARMAYLPPQLAAAHPDAIGVPIPGGSFRLEPVDGRPAVEGEGEGELVYSGPNVMLGYAESPADLARGRDISELRTGDLGRRLDSGLYAVVGRLGRFAKVYGLRIDLGHVERTLEGAGHAVGVTSDDRLLHVAVVGGAADAAAADAAAADADAADVERIAAQVTGLPPQVIEVRIVPALPRTASGKIDYVALAADATLADTARPADATAATCDAVVARIDVPEPRRASGAGSDLDAPVDLPETLRALYARLLGRPDASTHDSFVSLGGDSLSYVEVSLRLERHLGRLPAGWPSMPIEQLAAGVTAPPEARRSTVVETTVVVRAAAIVAVVGTHAEAFWLRGGAHVLLGVAGYNFARFHLVGSARERTQRLRAALLRIVVPSVVVIGIAQALTGDYSPAHVALVHFVTGQQTVLDESWNYWFVEALVAVLVLLAVLLRVPAVDRVQRAAPFGFVMALLGVSLLFRYGVLPGPAQLVHEVHPLTTAWVFLLGWGAAAARTTLQRLLVSAVVATVVWGFFGLQRRELVVVVGLLLITWLPTARLPRRVAALCGVLAGASLYIYLTHWLVFPHVPGPWAGVAASFAVGLACWRLALLVTRRVESSGRRDASPGSPHAPAVS